MKVVAWIPAGRARYLEVLIPYLLREKDLLDCVYLCVNTESSHDREYIDSLSMQDPSYFQSIYLDRDEKPSRHTVRHFYKYFKEEDTVYLKIDDDICFLQPGLLKELIQFRIEHPSYFLVAANLVNNVLCSYIHQHLGALNYRCGIYNWDPFCKVGWESGIGAENAHLCFLAAIKKGIYENFLFPLWEIADYARLSINLICYFGKDAKNFSPLMEECQDDESFLTEFLPPILARMNCIYGKKVGAHFSYFKQRDYLEQYTDLLIQYYLLR